MQNAQTYTKKYVKAKAKAAAAPCGNLRKEHREVSGGICSSAPIAELKERRNKKKDAEEYGSERMSRRKRRGSEYTGHNIRKTTAKQEKRQHEAKDSRMRGNNVAKKESEAADSEGRIRDLTA